MTVPQQMPPWHTLSPAEQAWHLANAERIRLERERLALAQRNRGTVNTLVGLFVWTPLLIGAALFLLWLVVNSL